ncbi:hypothetical protein M0R45_002603 [Rubus argutus]|uniref:Uncharacterized protein n=1 Tax=Rubus argutus TaxID=59490 RepID=A0AAW1VQG6_RUBAR
MCDNGTTSSLVEGADEDLIDLIYSFIKHTFQTSVDVANREAYYALSRILEEHTWFCSSRSTELIDLLLGLKSPGDILSLRSRFASFQTLMIHTLKRVLFISVKLSTVTGDSEEENAKAFLILNEIIVTLKDSRRDNKKSSKEVAPTDANMKHADSSTHRSDLILRLKF